MQHQAVGTGTDVHPAPSRTVLMDHLLWWQVPWSSLAWWHTIRLATLYLVIPRRSSPTPRSLSVRVARRKGLCCVRRMYRGGSSHDARGIQLCATRRRAPVHGSDRA